MRRAFLLIAVLLSISVASPATEASAAGMPYVVVLQDSVTDPSAAATELAARYGLQVTYVYSAGLKGFAALIPSTTAVTALSADSQVKFVQPDRTLTSTGGSTSSKKDKKGKKDKGDKKGNQATEAAPSDSTTPSPAGPSTAPGPELSAPVVPTTLGPTPVPARDDHKKDNEFSGIGRRFG